MELDAAPPLCSAPVPSDADQHHQTTRTDASENPVQWHDRRSHNHRQKFELYSGSVNFRVVLALRRAVRRTGAVPHCGLP